MRVPRANSVLIQSLMRDHGFDFSTTASTTGTAFLFTHEPYAACAFAEGASPAALEKLSGYLKEIEASRASEGPEYFRVPSGRVLWPFQRASLQYALGRRHCLVGDQPGLGKTPIAICFANEIRARSVLVVCPANIRLQWEKRIREWDYDWQWSDRAHVITSSHHGVDPSAKWTIISYDLVRQPGLNAALANRRYDVLILDEAHYLKTIDSLRTRSIFGGGHNLDYVPLAERAERVLALTGTPLPNRPREAYTLARAMCWDSIDWLSEDGFKQRFNPSRLVERFDGRSGETKTYIDERSGRHAELQARLRANFMCRHLKREVMPQLKMPIYDLIQVDETEAVRQALAVESLLDIDPESLEGADAEVLGHVAVARRLMGLAIAPQAADYVDMLIRGGEEKIVLFGWHIEVLDILMERLSKHGAVRIDGSTGVVRKEQLVERFIKDSKVQVIVGNIQSMGIGTDGLQFVSDHALIVEPSWTPGDNVQAFDRLDRGGQTRQVRGDIFVAPNSFAERVLASALRKNQVTHKALDQERFI